MGFLGAINWLTEAPVVIPLKLLGKAFA